VRPFHHLSITNRGAENLNCLRGHRDQKEGLQQPRKKRNSELVKNGDLKKRIIVAEKESLQLKDLCDLRKSRLFGVVSTRESLEKGLIEGGLLRGKKKGRKVR